MSTYISKTTFKSVSEELVEALKKIANSRKLETRHVQRAKFVLGKVEGKSDTQAGKEAGVHRNTVGTWKKRVVKSLDFLTEYAKEASQSELVKEILKVLSDEERSGRPRKYSEEQRSAIIKIACTDPKEYDYPNSHMTVKLIREIAIKNDIVTEAIALSTVWCILNEVDLKPQKTQVWLNSKDFSEDLKDFEDRVREVNEAYAMAAESPENVHIVCIDEKTGISARERLFPDKLAQPGKPALLEHGYDRHGSSTLISVFDVSTGEIIYHAHTDSHKEQDFYLSIKNTIELHPGHK